MMKIETISILGCGWYGYALAKVLLYKGYTVKGSTTAAEKLTRLQNDGIAPFLIDLKEDDLSAEQQRFFDCDVLIIASNVGLAQRSNYLEEIQRLINYIDGRQIKKLIFISSVSVYGEPNAHVDEDSAAQPLAVSAVLLAQAETLLAAQLTNLELTILRFGGLVGPGRMPGKFLAGKNNIANGLAPVNLIHLTDCMGLTEAVICSKTPINYLNGVHPNHPTRQDFYSLAAKTEYLPPPQFIPDLQSWKLVNSKYGNGFYTYQIANWQTWLNSSSASSF